MPDRSDDFYEEQGLSLDLPDYMVSALKRGVELHEQGLSGEGLKPETVREAKFGIENWRWTAEKWADAAAWLNRHNSSFGGDKSPFDADDPGPGEVAWYLWGDNGSGVGPDDWQNIEGTSGRKKANEVHERIKELDKRETSVSSLRHNETVGGVMDIKRARASVVKLTLSEIRTGSGVLVRPTLLATAYHVVHGATDGFEVRSPDGTRVQRGSVVHVDASNDLALVAIPVPFPGAVPATIAAGEVGDEAVAIGYPWGNDEISGNGAYATRGGISNRNGSTVYTDASVNLGNSGGGLFTEAGLVGIVVTGYFASGGQTGVSSAVDAALVAPMLAAYDAGLTDVAPQKVSNAVETRIVEYQRFAASHQRAHSAIKEVADMADQNPAPEGAAPVTVADGMDGMEEFRTAIADIAARLAACEEKIMSMDGMEDEPEEAAEPVAAPVDEDHVVLALEVAGVDKGHADLLVGKVAALVASGSKVRDAAVKVAAKYPKLSAAKVAPVAAPVAAAPAPVDVAAPLPVASPLPPNQPEVSPASNGEVPKGRFLNYYGV